MLGKRYPSSERAPGSNPAASVVFVAAFSNARRGAEAAFFEHDRHFLDRQAFGERDRTREDVAFGDLGDDLKGRHRLAEAVLASLQLPIRATQTGRDPERHRIRHDARVGETLGHPRHGGPGRQFDEDLVPAERPIRRAEPPVHEPRAAAGQYPEHDDENKQSFQQKNDL